MAMLEFCKARKRVLAGVVCLALLAGCWFCGLIGRLLTCGLMPLILPLRVKNVVEITSLACDASPAVPDRGVVLTISSGRLREIIDSALPFARLLPPGMIRDGMALRGAWMPDEFRLADRSSLPLMLLVSDEIGVHPRIVGRYPAEHINRLLKQDVVWKSESEEEWILGHYDLCQELTFEACHLYSEEEDLVFPVEKRRLILKAAGKVRYKVKDDFAGIHSSARATARVKELRGRIDITIVRDKKGVGFSCNAKVDVLKADFHNVAPVLDGQISEKLRKSLEKSFNRQRKRERFAKKRVPRWAPCDVIVDIQLTP